MPEGTRTILCVAHLPPPVHGVGVVSERVIETLRKRADLNVHVLPIRFSDSISDIGRYDARKAFRIVTLAARICGACMTCRPDFIYYTITPAGPAFYRDLLYVGVMKLFGIRRIYHLHGQGSAHAARTRAARFAYRWAFDGATVILLAERLYGEIESFVPKDRICVLPNGIPDPGPCVLNGCDDKTERTVPVILYLSNVAESKGALTLLRALAELKRRRIPFSAQFAGVMESAPFQDRFLALLRESNLEADVAYVGPKYGGEKDGIYRNADIVAFPTNNDTFPLVILEAMSYGLPVVSTREGAIEDMVEDSRTGYLIAKNDHIALAEKLDLLLTHPDLRHELGQQARRRYEESYTAVVFTNNLNRTIDSCLRRAVTESTTHKNDG